MAEAGSAAPATKVPERAKLHIAMMIFQFGYAGNHVVMRAALNMGVSKLVFPLYRNIVALIALAPFAKDRPAITLSFLLQFFFLGLVGITLNQGSYIFGLDNTSPTFASAVENAVPAIHLTRKDGIAKVLGTFVSVAGASVITLYKGPIIYSPNPPPSQQSHLSMLGDAKGKNWTLGCICLIGHCLFQGSQLTSREIHEPGRFTPAGNSSVFSIRTLTKLPLPLSLQGLVASAMAFAIQIWVIDRGGPVFVSAYLPVQTMLVAVMATIALGEEFYLGGIIGALLIISGLYLVVLGKNEESKYFAVISSTSTENKLVEGPGKASLVRPLLPTIAEC
ncbi:hypothetical protein JRO89_XS08G0139500 [Xanthoceras sorbifolium]|uniref:WAT1-related protein n=1 Tax=Xanthoceras sorbifolium TaxID=99658 RepID=A0ABQ8HPW9_9ROSI|nr:hypothetical protein JRO89_XS08G0139500 [Xanthoceras sorbifolium]